MFELHIIRHAQSANNALPESERVEDPPITKTGQIQVQRLAERFKTLDVTHALTSAFLRAIQTMQPLASAVKLRPAIWTDLHEVGGCFRGHATSIQGAPGMNRETLETEFSDFELPKDIDEDGWWKSKPYEDWNDAQERAEQQANKLREVFSDTNAKVACVIHADFKDLLLSSILQSDYKDYRHADLKNTGVTSLRWGPDQIEVVQFNDVSHLTDDLITS